jgi:hypothetical protein
MEIEHFDKDMKEGINAKEFSYFQDYDCAVIEDCPADVRETVFAVIHNGNIG